MNSPARQDTATLLAYVNESAARDLRIWSRKSEPCMPRFFFDIDDGESCETDGRGSELLNAQAARNAAIAILPDVAREELPDGDRRIFMCKVRDENGNVIFIATLSLVAEWINRGASAK